MSEALEDWIGRSRTQEALVDPELLRRFAAAIGTDMDVEAHFPPLGQWALFNDVVGPEHIGPDGHPRCGIFLPPIPLPRRMFGSATLRFEAPLAIGRTAELVTLIADIRRRTGRSGDLILLETERRLSQGGQLCAVERQIAAYRPKGDRTTPVAETAVEGGGDVWRPTPVDLFRFSAATYNCHRIHYDQPYTVAEEGYPDLLVHGPFTAAKLCALAERLAGGRLKSFSFRAEAPLFVNQPVLLRPGEAPSSVVAIRCDGAPAMSADYEA